MDLVKQYLNIILIASLKIFMLLAISVITCVIFYRLKYKRFYNLINKIPGPSTIPIFGNIHNLILFNLNDAAKFMLDFGKNYGSPGKIMLSEIPYVLINNPEHFQVVLNASIDRSHLARKLASPLIGNSFFITKDRKRWSNRRKTFGLSLTPAILETFIPVFQEYAQVLKKNLELEIGKKQPFDVWNYIAPVSFELVLRTSMSLSIDFKSNIQPFIKAIDYQAEIMTKRVLRAWLLIDPIFKLSSIYKKQSSNLETIFNIINTVIEEKLTKRKEKGKLNQNNNKEKDESSEQNSSRKVFLDLLMDITENDPSWTTQDLCDETSVFFFGSYHTSAGTMCYLLLNLAFHQEVQEKLYEELKSIFGDSEREANSEDFSKMIYLEKCIFESIRMHPIGPIDFRYLDKDIVLDDYIIPKDTTVVLNYLGLNHNEIFWKNSKEFDPERFSPENVKNMHPYAHLPFGGGLRTCIGKRYAMISMKILISSILRKYKITTPLNENELVLKFGFFLRNAQGFKINIEKRV